MQQLSFLTEEYSGAIFDEKQPDKYRYLLWRTWSPNRPKCTFILLNPSTADEIENDPTVTRCIKYAQTWGYGSLTVVNIFALRSTDPDALYNTPNPIGPENDKYIHKAVKDANLTVLAFGNHGSHLSHGQNVIEMLSEFELHYLTKTQSGWPGHPLYLKKTLKPLPWA